MDKSLINLEGQTPYTKDIKNQCSFFKQSSCLELKIKNEYLYFFLNETETSSNSIF